MRSLAVMLWIGVCSCDGVIGPMPSLDAGQPFDAGGDVVDAGPDDAGHLDAGATDAGTFDAGAVDAGQPDAGPMVPDAGRPVFIAVGYEGVRVASFDLGATWNTPQKLGADGDNEFLLRGVVAGNGLFVTVGWKILTTTDGVTWTPRTNPQNQWLQGLSYSNGLFSAVGGYGYSAWSADGLTWVASTFRDAEAARSMATGLNGVLMAGTDPGNWWKSTDGKTWVADSSGHGSSEVVWCDTEFRARSACPQLVVEGGVAHGEGVWLRLGGGGVQRSVDDGGTFAPSLQISSGLVGIAFGYLP